MRKKVTGTAIERRAIADCIFSYSPRNFRKG